MVKSGELIQPKHIMALTTLGIQEMKVKKKPKMIFYRVVELKNEIENNRNEYETLVDKATLELENFIKRNDPDTKIQ